jgi:hypothetical protein
VQHPVAQNEDEATAYTYLRSRGLTELQVRLHKNVHSANKQNLALFDHELIILAGTEAHFIPVFLSEACSITSSVQFDFRASNPCLLCTHSMFHLCLCPYKPSTPLFCRQPKKGHSGLNTKRGEITGQLHGLQGHSGLNKMQLVHAAVSGRADRRV